MDKVDVAIQSFKKPESLIYTLFSLKKYCGENIDTIYINDDCSGEETVKYYFEPEFLKRMEPIKIKVHVNDKPSGYTTTLMTKEAFSKKDFITKVQLLMHIFIRRIKFCTTSDNVRYQWAINNTNKKHLLLVHDDIKFYKNVIQLYLPFFYKDKLMAIVGDLGGARLCPYAPCGENCSPENILKGYRPCEKWPITGSRTVFHRILGRYRRDCRINEWCCMLDVSVARMLTDKYGIFFGNYEGGGDVGTMWFDKIIQLKYHFIDPLPGFVDRKKYYLHWWQGHEGHEIWVDYGRGKQRYRSEYIKECLKNEFNYIIK